MNSSCSPQSCRACSNHGAGSDDRLKVRHHTDIVRAVGGLVDTVFDRDYAPRPFENRNGYVFHHHDNSALESAFNRAIGLWYAYPAEFRQLVFNGVR
jgi:starch synthase